MKRLSPITPSAMLEIIPSSLAFPMDHLYSKLKNATGFYEMVERVGDMDWLYGCVQNDDMLFVLTSTSSRVSVRDIVSRSRDGVRG